MQKSYRRRLWAFIVCLSLILAALPAAAQAPEDGQIVFTSYAINTNGDDSLDTRDLSIIFVINPDGTGRTQITDGTSLDRSPVWDPTGTRIAFVSRIDTNEDETIDQNDTASLDVINADGTGRLSLVSDTLNVTEPVWAPTGEMLAFISHRDENEDGAINESDIHQVYVVGAEGGGLRPLTEDDMDATGPTWSSDGKRVAFSAVTDTNGDGVVDKREGDLAHIYVYDLDAGEMAPITEGETSDFSPQFSPDGTQIAYVSFRYDNTQDGKINESDIPSINIIDADGRNREQLTEDEYIDFEPRWSPDGTVIAFHSYRLDTNGDGELTIQDAAGVYKVSARGGNRVRLSALDGSAEQPTWSPDGTRIAYHGRIDSNGDGMADAPNLFITDATIEKAEDQQITQITTNQSIDFQADWSHPGAEPPPAPTAEPPAEAAPTFTPPPTTTPASGGQPPQTPAGESPTSESPLVTATPATGEEQPPEAPSELVTATPAGEMPQVAPTPAEEEEPPLAPLQPVGGPMRMAYASRNIDTTGDSLIDARDHENIMVLDTECLGTPEGCSGQALQVTGPETDDGSPVWSPDGQWIAFTGHADTTGDGIIKQNDPVGLYVVSASGGDVTRITPPDMYAARPAWAPDSARLVFQAAKHDTDDDGFITEWDNTNLYLVNRDGSELVQLTLDPSSDFDPHWSPEGDQIVFASRANDINGDGIISVFDPASLFVMGVDGSNLTQITSNESEDQAPRWSPDGLSLAFVSWTDDTNGDGFVSADRDRPGVFVMGADGTNRIRLTAPEVYALYPTWNPDGSLIAYVVRVDSNLDGELWFSDGGYLYMTDYGGNLSVQLTNDTFGTLQPAWSPDGQMIAYHTWGDTNGDGEVTSRDVATLYALTIEGDARIPITDDSFSEFAPAWAAQGAE